MTTGSVRQTVADYFTAIRAMDADAWLSTFAENAVSHDPVGAPPSEGHAALRQFFEGIAGAFEKVELFEDSVFVAGDSAAVKWTGRGTGKNGRDVIFEGIDVFEINADNKIQTIWGYWDPSAMMSELMG
ncbi:MAG TPA: nuclear transport factor 2 family protein [Blastocatellia bacterium]|jgi:steroid delta-isomerase|nr:nuclear transport factor 2 family protein [Blastocatellia bacterium]